MHLIDHPNRATVLAWVGLLALAVCAARAQAAVPPAEKAAEKPAEEAPAVSPEASPAVQAILETKPTTPKELARAAKILADLERPDLAKKYLSTVLAANLDQQALAALQAELGSPVFIELGSRKDLAPEGTQLADAVLAAAQAELTAPKRLAQLVSELNAPTADVRFMAMDQLRRARGAAVGPLLAVLADPAKKAEHANVLAALVRLKSDAIGPLLGVIETGGPALKAEAIRGLSEMQARGAAIYLLAPFAAKDAAPQVAAAAKGALERMLGGLPSPTEAATVLAKRAKSYLDFREPLTVDEEDRVEIWSWDAAQKQPVAKTYSRGDAYRLYAAWLARDAHAIAPDDPQIRRLYLAAILEEAAYANGLDNPLPDAPGTAAAEAAGFGNDVLQGLLSYAMDEGYWAAATAAARLLGEKGTALELLYNRAEPGPLVVAVGQPDRRLRFAAAEAVVKLAPTQPYAGSSEVLDAIAYFAGTSGTRRAIVAGPVSAESMRVAGYLAALGYEVDTAVNGRGLIRLALDSPDYELALVDSSLFGPTPELLLQQLRHDCRTAMLPVGILARSDQNYQAGHAASHDRLAAAFPRPHTDEDAQAIVAEVIALAGPELVPHEARMQEAAAAIEWLAQLSNSSQKIYDLLRVQDEMLAAQFVPELGPAAMNVLGSLGTPESQKDLVDVASRWTQPLGLRQAAAAAFEKSVRQYGIQLTAAQILQQYDRYNESANRDAETQRVLGSILDTIEAPSKAQAEQAKRERGEISKSQTSNDKQIQNPESK